MFHLILKLCLLCTIVAAPISHGINSVHDYNGTASLPEEITQKRVQQHQRRRGPNFHHGKFCMHRPRPHPRRSKRSYQDFYTVWDGSENDDSHIGNGWGGDVPSSKKDKSNKSPPNQVQDVFLQSVNSQDPYQPQQQNGYQNQPIGPPPQGPGPNQGNFNAGPPGYGHGSQQNGGAQNSGNFGSNSGQNRGQQSPPFQGGPIGPNGPFQQQHEPSNNGGYNNRDSFSDYGSNAFQNNQNEEPTAKHELYYQDPGWSDHLPNQGDRSHEQKHWLHGDPNAKSPGYKPTLPPVPVGRKTYWDFKDEDARDLQKVFDNADERARKNPHSYAPVPGGKLMTNQRRREEYNYNVPAFRRREDMEKSGELARVPQKYYVEPLKYVDRNFKFMEIGPPRPKWGKQSQAQQDGKKKVEDDPTPYIEWSKFSGLKSHSTILLSSINSNFLSILVSQLLLLHFIL